MAKYIVLREREGDKQEWDATLVEVPPGKYGVAISDAIKAVSPTPGRYVAFDFSTWERATYEVAASVTVKPWEPAVKNVPAPDPTPPADPLPAPAPAPEIDPDDIPF